MNIINVIKKMAQPIMMISYQVSGLSARKNDTWIFGAWRGQQYSDNSKYIFEYINTYHPEIECIWVTKNHDVAKQIREKGYKVCCGHSLQTLFAVLRAGVVFETEGVQDIPFHWFLKGIKTIQLFHGFTLKSGSKWVEHGQFIRSKRPWQNQYDKMYWMSTSPAYSEIYHNWGLIGVRIPKSQFLITGYARNDAFIKKPDNIFLNNFRCQHPDSKLICYMPTHRNFGKSGNGVLSEKELELVNQKLKEMNVYMLLKPHFHEIQNFLGKENVYDHIIFAYTDEFSDVYGYLYGVDLLISDYSIIMDDYLCADKPIVVFFYVLEEYMEHDAGLEKIYFSLDFGPRCRNWQEVLSEVEIQLKNDTWKEKRRDALNITQTYNDGNNCERIYENVKNLCMANDHSRLRSHF